MFQNIQGQAIQEEEYEETNYKESIIKKFLKVAFTPRKNISIYSVFYAL